MSIRLIFASMLVLAACASDDPDDNAFDGDCAGSNAQCGKVSVRWKVDRAGKEATCAVVGGTTVVATAKFQADGRTTNFEATCEAGALLTTPLPVGPYELTIILEDAAGNMLDKETALATLGVSNTVTETSVVLDIVPKIVAGGEFGACSASQPCTNPAHDCVLVPGSNEGYCSPECASTTVCRDLYAPYAHDLTAWDVVCAPTDIANPSVHHCVAECSNPGSAGPSCAPGLTCQAVQPYGPVCVP